MGVERGYLPSTRTIDPTHAFNTFCLCPAGANEVRLPKIDKGQALMHSVLNRDVSALCKQHLLGLEWWGRRVEGVILRPMIHLARYEVPRYLGFVCRPCCTTPTGGIAPVCGP